MMKTLRTWSVVCLCLLSAGVVRGEPLKLAEVSNEARWVVHVDFDAMRASTVVQKIIARVKQKHPQMETHMALVQGFIGMNPLKDLHGVTFYGPEAGKHQGVMIFRANFSPSHLERAIPFLKDYKAEKVGDKLTIHTWSHQHHHGPKLTPAAALIGDKTLVVANDVGVLKKSLEVLSGKSAGVKDDSPLAGNVPQGTTVLARIGGINKVKLPHQCNLAKQTESFRFVVGENEGISFFRARAVMTNTEIVEQVKTVVAGAKALGTIHAGDDAQKKQMVDGLKVKSEDKTLTLLWSASADQVWAQIEAHAKRIEEHMARRREYMKKHGHEHGHGPHHHAHGGKPGEKSQEKKKSSEDDF